MTGKPVPSVLKAVAILEFLDDQGEQAQTLTVIAQATKTNPSTCLNILKTLQATSWVSYNPEKKQYRLGPRAVTIGRRLRDGSGIQGLGRLAAQNLVDRLPVNCYLMVPDSQDSFVVIDRVETDVSPKLSIDLGTRFTGEDTLAARAWSLAQPGGDSSGARFAVSKGQHYGTHNAVAAPITNVDGVPIMLLVAVGPAVLLDGEELELAGAAVADAAQAVSTASAEAIVESGGSDAP